MKDKPLVSICIPAYNSERYIVETVEHALNQTWENIEVIVLDDQSTDGTVEKLKTIHDPRFRFHVNEKNLGMTGNWNACVQACRGDYVKLIPADDLLYPTCIERSVPYLIKHPDITLVSVASDLIDNEDRVIGRYAHWPRRGVFAGEKMAKASIMLNDFFGNPVSLLFRKADYERTGGFDPDIPYILDFDLCLGLAALGRVAVIKDRLAAFRVRTDSNTGQMTGAQQKAYTEEHARLVDKHRRQGTYRMNDMERWMSVTWRSLRNHLIAAYIKIKSR